MNESSPPLRHYLDVVRRQAWLIAITVAAAVLAAFVYTTYLQDSAYRASMNVVVGQGGGIFQPQFGNTVEPFTQTMTNLLESDIVASTVIDNLQLDMTPEELLANLEVSSRPESAVLQMTFQSPRPRQAVTILSEVGTVFADLVDRRLGSSAEPSTGTEAQVPQITVSTFDPAHLEPGTIEASAGSTMAIAALLGLALGLVLAFVRDALDDRIRSPRDAEEAFRAPVIGAIPKGLRETRITSPSKLVAELPRDVMEALYFLRANLQFSEVGTSGPVLVLTSAVPKEGKSLVGASLAVTLALSGSRVICVEADVRRPELHTFLGVEPRERGLVDALEHDESISNLLVEVPLNPVDAALAANGGFSSRWHMTAKADVELDEELGRRSFWGRSGPRSADVSPFDMSLVGSLKLLPAGNVTSNPANLLTRSRTERFVEELRAQADVVIFDTPPVLGVGDAFPLMSLADMVLVVARYGELSRTTAESVQSTLMRLGVRKVSVVLNEAPSGTMAHGLGPVVPERTTSGVAGG